MNTDALNNFRRERLDALATHMGGRAALGRALGYKDGGYINHMVNGLRPITEKTIAMCEELPGATGWFSDTKYQERALSREVVAAIAKLEPAEVRRIENLLRGMLDIPQLRSPQ
ncbi:MULTISPECIES: hypothetical protein [unclassified Delftia]|jgi:hypothetical protein|uniref:hypothetical protein n=1 Tax=unclassified Delftia TaxID=2613839 RepID=UPI0005C19C5C|nr:MULTISPECIES: hypothetical protein [unclassified Delftia]MCB4787079.1 hypothetical protein [Delftia sp. Lp-1]